MKFVVLCAPKNKIIILCMKYLNSMVVCMLWFKKLLKSDMFSVNIYIYIHKILHISLLINPL